MNELLHALAALMLPPTGALPLLLLAWWLKSRWRWLARGLFVLGLAAIWLGSTEMGAQWLQARLLEVHPPLKPQRLAERPPEQTAIVVLGAGAHLYSPEFFGPQLKPLSVERLRYGIWLARQCGCPVMATGGRGRAALPHQPSEAQLADEMAREQFGFQLRWLEQQSHDTRENAQYSTRMLQGTGVTRVVLVTHEMHMPRALRAFRAALPPDMELLAAPMDINPPDFRLLHALPSAAGIAQARYLGYELLGWWAGH